MAAPQITLAELVDVLRSSGGDSAELTEGREILDTDFTELGYDSVALLETAGEIERRWSVLLPEEAIVEARTPRLWLDQVNRSLADRA